jgi:NAD(P)H-flavin reductase
MLSGEALVVRDAMLPEPYQVLRRQREVEGTYTIVLQAASTGFEFLPGQFNMLYVFGVGEVPISISGDPACREQLVHTTRSVGLVTQAINRLSPGDHVGVRGPFGSAWPLAEAQGKDLLIVAGGLGLAPLRPVIYSLLYQRQRYGNISILCGARNPADILYREELSWWRERCKLPVAVTVDFADRSWHGKVGVVTRLIAQAAVDPGNAVALVCGPEAMMRYSLQELLARGFSCADIYLSMERNMQCALGFCGHCMFGPHFLCKDGPVLRYDKVEQLFNLREM